MPVAKKEETDDLAAKAEEEEKEAAEATPEPEPYSVEAGNVSVEVNDESTLATVKIAGTFDANALISIEKQITHARVAVS